MQPQAKLCLITSPARERKCPVVCAMKETFCREKDGGCFLPKGNDSAVLCKLNPKHSALTFTLSAKS